MLPHVAVSQQALTNVLVPDGLPVLNYPNLFEPLGRVRLGAFGDKSSDLCGDRTGSAGCDLEKNLQGTSIVCRASAAN